MNCEEIRNATTVKTFDMDYLNMLIDDCDPMVIDYIDSLKMVINMQEQNITRAKKKIIELNNKM